MKKYQKLLFSAFALLGLLTGCDKIDPFDSSSETPGQKTIVEIVTGDRNFSRLAQAVTRANLAGDLGGQNLTLFAPNNAAFAAAGIDSVAIARMAPATLANILKYHVLSSAVRTSDLSVGVNQPRPTLNGTAYISKFNFGLSVVAVNGVRVTLSDIAATNGVIHILDNVLLPPTGTIVDVVRGNPSFTFLLAAVTRANLGGGALGGRSADGVCTYRQCVYYHDSFQDHRADQSGHSCRSGRDTDLSRDAWPGVHDQFRTRGLSRPGRDRAAGECR